MALRRRRTVPGARCEPPRDAHADHRHTETPALAGDASTRSAANDPTAPNDPTDRAGQPGDRQRTGPITKIGRVFGASSLAVAVIAGPTAAAQAAARGPVVEHGRAVPLDLPAPADEYVALTAQPGHGGAWAVERDGTVTAAGTAKLERSFPTHPVVDPAVGIAGASPRGYWVVTKWGRVRAYGDADRLGSHRLAFGGRHVVGIAARRGGRGYWLATNDGAVFAFGSAGDHGDLRGIPLSAPIVAIAATSSGAGYYLLASDGALFAFGDARHRGAPLGIIGNADAVGVATDAQGVGYWIALRNGTLLAYAAGASHPAPPSNGARPPSTTAVSAARPGGVWVLHGRPRADHMHPFLVCTRSHESSGSAPAYDDGYRAVSPSGTYRGAYQFSRSTWNSTARHAGRPELVGVDPAAASAADQDELALVLYEWQGADPWLGRCDGR
jgi:hypothetical protein